MSRSISIHAPNAGSDNVPVDAQGQPQYFNPRSQCRERPGRPLLLTSTTLFQSTLPMQGATSNSNHHRAQHPISIHAPNAGSDLLIAVVVLVRGGISIHAPNAGSNSGTQLRPRWSLYFNPRSQCRERRLDFLVPLFASLFQSTLPMQGATRRGKRYLHS